MLDAITSVANNLGLVPGVATASAVAVAAKKMDAIGIVAAIKNTTDAASNRH